MWVCGASVDAFVTADLAVRTGRNVWIYELGKWAATQASPGPCSTHRAPGHHSAGVSFLCQAGPGPICCSLRALVTTLRATDPFSLASSAQV